MVCAMAMDDGCDSVGPRGAALEADGQLSPLAFDSEAAGLVPVFFGRAGPKLGLPRADAPISPTASNGRQTIDKTRKRILRAADRCFRRNGLQRTSVDDIAEEAGVSRATVYNRFPNKREIIAEVAAADHRSLQREALAQLDFGLQSADLLVQAQLVRLEAGLKSPYAVILRAPTALSFTHDLFLHSDTFHEAQIEYWSGIFTEIARRNELCDDLDIDSAVRWIDLVNLLFADLAKPTRERQARAMIRRYVVPAFIKCVI